MSNILDMIKNDHIRSFQSKGKMKELATVAILKSCRSYGYVGFIPPSRSDVSKAVNIFNNIKESGSSITIIDLINMFVENWPQYNLGSLPDLGKLPLVYKRILQKERIGESPIELED